MNHDIQETPSGVAGNYLEEREKLLSLPPAEVLEHILNHREPDALVKSIPEEDLYFLVHDIGPEDVLDLLSLASSEQWDYLLDLESWQRDRLDIPVLTKWLGLLLKADPRRLLQWLLKDKTDLFEFYLSKNIEVVVREHDQDPADFGTEFFTFDDVYYIRIVENQLDETRRNSGAATRKAVLSRLLERLAEVDHIRFQQVLVETRGIIPAEAEEEAYRLRNIRLAEKGFLPLDEALGVYQYRNPYTLTERPTGIAAAAPAGGDAWPVPIYPKRMMEPETLFSSSLQVIEAGEVLQALETEFVTLCNRIITADQLKVHDRELLKSVVRKACGYLSIGLGRLVDLSAMSPERQRTVSAANLARFPLLEIFRVGYGAALELKWRAEKWLKDSWFKSAGLTLSFWGESWLGVLGGLLLKRPLYYDNYKTGVLYREFVAGADVSRTAKELEAIIAFDDLLSLLRIPPKPVRVQPLLSHKNLLLTLWSRRHLNLSRDFRPLTLDEFKAIVKELWTDEHPPRRVREAVKTAFLDWLVEETGRDAVEISDRLGETFEALFGEIESEYGYVPEGDLDPRYIHLFLVAKTAGSP